MNAETTPPVNDPGYEDKMKRISLGKAGKLWRIEVLYKVAHETKRVCITDRTGREVREFRELVYTAGLAVPIDPGHFKVISPFDILEVDVWKQDKYFGELYP